MSKEQHHVEWQLNCPCIRCKTTREPFNVIPMQEQSLLQFTGDIINRVVEILLPHLTEQEAIDKTASVIIDEQFYGQTELAQLAHDIEMHFTPDGDYYIPLRERELFTVLGYTSDHICQHLYKRKPFTDAEVDQVSDLLNGDEPPTPESERNGLLHKAIDQVFAHRIVKHQNQNNGLDGMLGELGINEEPPEIM